MEETKDAIGRAIHIGDVCVHVRRQSSNLDYDALVIRELVSPKEVRGDKFVVIRIESGERRFINKASKIIRARNVIILGTSEDEIRTHMLEGL